MFNTIYSSSIAIQCHILAFNEESKISMQITNRLQMEHLEQNEQKTLKFKNTETIELMRLIKQKLKLKISMFRITIVGVQNMNVETTGTTSGL